MKEKIMLVEQIIENDRVKITSDCTMFANWSRLEELNINDILNKYKQVIKAAKQKNIKISYKHKTKQILTENKDLYTQEVKQRNQVFDTLKNKWELKLQKGIYSGYIDDEEMKELSELDCQLQKYVYRSCVLSIIGELNYRLDQLLNRVLTNNDIEKIWL